MGRDDDRKSSVYVCLMCMPYMFVCLICLLYICTGVLMERMDDRNIFFIGNIFFYIYMYRCAHGTGG